MPSNIEHAVYRRLDILRGIEAIEATFTHHQFRPHYHETYLVGVTEGGAERFSARGATHLSSPLSLRFHNPGEVHAGGAPPGGHWTYRCLYPDQALFEDLLRDTPGRRDIWFPDVLRPDPLAAGALIAAFKSLSQTTSALERSIRFRHALTAVLLRHASDPPALRPVRREPRTIARAQAYIADHATDDYTLDVLAQAVGLSPFHFVRAFKAQVGITPFAFQAQCRVERAKDLLVRGRSVDDAARACGFYDRSHLTRTFKSIMGVSPTALRAAR